MTKQMTELPHPLALQRKLEALLPGIWDAVSYVRNGKGVSTTEHWLKDWAEWCYIPLPAWYAITRALTEKPERVSWTDATLIAAVGTWRLGKGVYRYDEELYSELISTPIADNLPVEVFFRLPEYCVYIETPGLTFEFPTQYKPLDTTTIHGFYAFIDDDQKKGVYPTTLRLVYEGGLNKVFPVELKIPKGGMFKTEFEKIYFDEKKIATTLANPVKGACTGLTRELIISKMVKLGELAAKTLPLLLYLCTEEPDYGDKTPPVYAIPKKTKTGLKWFPAAGIKNWDVGVRIGATIRKYREQTANREPAEHGSGRAPVRPHMRSAHWQGYWTGKRSELLKRKYILHWIPPIPVNMHDEDAPAVIRPVKK